MAGKAFGKTKTVGTPVTGSGDDDVIDTSDKTQATKINGGDGSDSIIGTEAADRVNAGDGNDTVRGGLGDDILFGNDGEDTAVFSGSIVDYVWEWTNGNTLNVSGDDGNDQLKHFEYLQFDDFSFSLDGNNAPFAVLRGAATTEENTALTLSVDAYDFDGDAVSIVSVSSTRGSVSAVEGLAATQAAAMGSSEGLEISFDPLTDFDYLAEGVSTVETVTLVLSDSAGNLTTTTFEITVTGSNDAPTLAAGVATAVEDGPTVEVELSVLGDDLDSDDDGTTLVYTVSGQPSEGSATVSGTKLIFDPGADFQDLAAGETRDVVIEITAKDGHNATAVNTVTVTVTGTNDAPTISATPASGWVEAGDAAAQTLVDAGVVSFDDVDASDTVDVTFAVSASPVWSGGTLTAAQIATLEAGFTTGTTDAAAPGAIPWTYGATLDLDFLGEGETISFEYLLTATDTHGAPATDTVRFTITGTNDTPEITSGAVDLDLTEAASPTDLLASGAITFADLDANDSHTVVAQPVNVSFAMTGGMLSPAPFSPAELGLIADALEILPDGTWTLALPGALMERLSEGSALTLSTQVGVQDDSGAANDTSLYQPFEITVVGTNDQPVIESADTSGSVTEIADDAPGEGATLLTATGSVRFTDVDAFDQHSVTVTPQGAGYFGSFSVPAGNVSGPIPPASTGGTFGWTFEVQDAALEFLAEGQTLSQTYEIVIDDGQGGTASETVTIEIVGSNDGPTAVADSNAADPVVEQGSTEPGDPSATGNVLANDSDPDAGTVLFVSAVDGAAGNVGESVTGTYGALVIASDGTWTYTLDDSDPDTDALSGGQVVTEVFTYEVSDGDGGTDTASLTIAITGSDDNRPPVAEDASASTDEDVTLSGMLTATDPDLGLGDTLTFAVESGPSNGSVTVQSDGSYVYTPGTHYSGSDSFTYRVTDAAGAFDIGTITIGVEAVADAPDLSIVDTGGTEVSLIGEDFRVNTTVAGSQRFASVAELENGGFVVTWSGQNSNHDSSGFGIVAQLFDASGNKVGSEIPVNSTVVSTQIYSAVDGLPDGGFIVTWQDGYRDGSGYGIVQQRFAADGAKVGAEQLVNSYTFSTQQSPDVTVLEDGGWIVVWDGPNTAPEQYDGIYMQRYAADGSVVGGEQRVNAVTTQAQIYAASTALPDGGWVVTYSSYLQDGSGWGVFMRHFDANGNAATGDQRVNTIVASEQSFSHVDTLKDGGWVVTWSSFLQDGSGYGVYAQRYDASGSAVGNEVPVNTYTTGHQYFSSVQALSDGGWIIAYDSFGLEGNGYGLAGQRYAADGSAVGEETILTTRTAGDQWTYGLLGGTPIVQLQNGTLVLVYDENYGSGEVYASLISVATMGGNEDEPFALDLSAALVDTDGSETLELVMTGFPAGASFNLGASDGNGGWVIPDAQSVDLSTLTMTPPANWNGTFDLTVVATATEASNGDTASSTQTATYTIAPVNDAPEAVADTAVTQEDTPVFIDVTANDSDPVEGDTVSVIAATGAAHGTLSIDTKGTADTTDDEVLYTPDAHFSGTDSFTYTLRDAGGATTTGTVEVTVEAVADAPTVTFAPIAEAPVPQGNDMQVNTYTSSLQRFSRIAALEDGGFIATWNSYGQDGSEWGVYARRYDADGQPTSTGEMQINGSRAYSQLYSTPVGLPDGGYLIAWSDNVRDGSGYGIYMQRFDAAGNAVGNEERVNTYTASSQTLPDVTVLEEGGWVVTWMSFNQVGQQHEIYQQRYDSVGAVVGSEQRVNRITANDQNSPSTAATADGGWITTWGSYNQDGSNWGIYSQRFNAAGAAVGGETLVNTYTDGQQIHSHVDTLQDGGWIIAWQGLGDQPGYGVYYQRYDATGAAVGDVVLASSAGGTSKSYAHVEGLDDGGWIIAYNFFGADGSAQGIVGQRYAADGTPIGSETVLTGRTFDDQYNYGFFGGSPMVQLANGDLALIYDEDFGNGEIFLSLIDLPTLAGVEDTPMAIDLTVALVDTDGSEVLDLVLTGFPAGATFNLGTSDGMGGWEIADAANLDLSTLTMTPPADWNGDFDLTVTATATETSNGDTATTVATQTLTIDPDNDAPVADDLTLEADESFAVQPVTTSGQLTASDIDLGDTLTWTAGTFATAHGTVTIHADGSFDYTPAAGFMGVDGFSATVRDAEGLTDTAEVRVEVATETFTSPGGQQVWLDLNAGAVGDSPAGAVSISLSPYQSPAVNLVIAMDSSGSVGNVGWGDMTDAVQQALLDIATLFDGSGIDLDAHVFGFSGQTSSTLYIQVADGSAAPATMTGAPGTSVADVDLDLSTVGALNAQIDAMVYPAGTTPWNAAFQQAEAYFDAEFIEDGENALNLMLFITDGNPFPTQQDWQQSLANLINENFIQSGASGLPGAGVYQPLASDTDTYSVDIQSFGVGTNLNMTALGDTDSDGSATPVNSFQDLSAALSGSALFPAELVSLEVTLAVDGAAAVSIADETTPGLQVGSVSIDLALADIAGIEGLLGDVNEVAVQAVFDLDGDLGTTTDQVTLSSLEQIAFGADALTFVGTDGNDLALGSDGIDHMQGGLGNDVLLAGLGSDTVIGGAGDDRLGGGADADDFVFAAGDGLDTILDYNAAEDQITFTGGLAFGDLTIQQAGADVTISHGSDLITVLSASATDFIADEFVFL